MTDDTHSLLRQCIEVYAGARHLGTYDSTQFYFSHADWLGTERRVTYAADPNTRKDCTSLPFGDWLTCTGSATPSPLHFTGQERDSESGLDHFWFRKYSSTQGRWLSPDPAGLAAVDLTNPQSWNRYAYVLNDPTNAVDPLGLCPGCAHWNQNHEREIVKPAHARGMAGVIEGYSPIELMVFAFSPTRYRAEETLLPATEVSHFIFVPGSIDIGLTLSPPVVSVSYVAVYGSIGITGLIGGSSGGDAGPANNGVDVLGTLGQFFRGRPSGQTFNECVNNNIKLLSGGTVDPQKLFSPALGAAEGLATTLATVPGGTFTVAGKTGSISVGTRLLQLATGAAGLTGTTRLAVVSGGVAALRAGAVAGAATLGALIGSAANCAAPGVF